MNYSRVAILYSDKDVKEKNGTDIHDEDQLVLKGKAHLGNIGSTIVPLSKRP